MNGFPGSHADVFLGSAHALVFGVFLLAAAGKLAACRPGMRVMCTKGGLDAAFALLACLVTLPGIAQAGAVAAVAVGAGGWLREKIRRNTTCNCFGVLTPVLHPWRNGMRAALFGAGLLALLLAPQMQPAAPGLWLGAALGLSGLLVLTGWIFARSVLSRQAPKRIVAKAPARLEEGKISPLSVVGTDRDGRTLALHDLLEPGQPLPILLTSPNCKSCQSLKAQLEPLLPGMAFKLHIVIEGAPASTALPAAIFDPAGQWRKTLGVNGLPALAIVNGSATNLAVPVLLSPDAMFLELLRLQTGAASASTGQAKEEAMETV
jgi:hypothetical protein